MSTPTGQTALAADDVATADLAVRDADGLAQQTKIGTPTPTRATSTGRSSRRTWPGCNPTPMHEARIVAPRPAKDARCCKAWCCAGDAGGA